jgi:hypothetical protein
VQPDVLFLGQKDAQQLAVVRRFVRDLDRRSRAGADAARADGLAMSSRNVSLTPTSARWRDLTARCSPGAAEPHPVRPPRDVVAATSALLLRRRARPDAVDEALARPRFQIDYLAVVDEVTFIPRATWPRSRPVVAARLGHRLINVQSPSPGGDPTSHRTASQRTPPGTRPHERKDHHGDRLRNGKRQDHVREGLVRVITGSIEFSSTATPT